MSSARLSRTFSQRAYLASPEWAERRAAYERHPEAPHRCAVCAAPRYQLHHRTYERWGGHERITDLIALCDAHHEALHRAHRRQGGSMDLQTFTDAWVRLKRQTYKTNALLPSLALYAPGRPLAMDRGLARGDRGLRGPLEQAPLN